MSEMNRKKVYVWRLGAFLHSNRMTMSGEELAAHLNRNGFKMVKGKDYEGLRGTYSLLTHTWRWVNNDLGLHDEAKKIAEAFVKPNGKVAWK